MKRKEYTRPNDIICQICKKPVSPYNFNSHIIRIHHISIESYIDQFGEYRKNKLEIKKPTRNIIKIECQICNNQYSIIGISTHLRDSHNITTDQYINQYGEYRPKYIKYNQRSKENDFKCLICNLEEFASHNHFAYHVRINHNIDMINYVQQYIFKNEKQYCLCNCGQEVKIIERPPYKSCYISGHNPNGMIGKIHTQLSKNKMSMMAIKRMNNNQSSYNTKPELEFRNWLMKYNIKFTSQNPTEFGNIDFYLPEYDLYVEIDGDYWHPEYIEYLNLQTLQGIISQLRRNKLQNAIRIRASTLGLLNNINTVEDLKKLNHIYDYSVDYKQCIVDKNYILTLREDEKNRLVNLFCRFILENFKTFQYPQTSENLNKIQTTILNTNLSELVEDNIFRNNISNIGVSYLKSKFKSYWNSSFKNSITPIQAWETPAILNKLIQYRVGLNRNMETFDLSLHQIIRGISAARYSISFFKPLLASSIYYKFLGNKEMPIVFDPCAGFGGRLLGFKSKYPNGKYIGLEPNIETYNELVELAKNFSNVDLYNCKAEDYELKEEVDLTFTSIPYYDLETYSNPIKYTNFQEWKNIFLNKILSFPNLVLNVPNKLRFEITLPCIEYFIKSNTSHFDKNTTKTEFLLKF